MELQSDLECGICTDTFTDPRVLSCQHVFCLSCLTSLAGDKTHINCPLCREVTLLDSHKKVEGLQKPVILNKVKETITSLSASLREQSKERICSLGADLCLVSASLFFKDCADHMCSPCFDQHKTIPGFAEHVSEQQGDLPECVEHTSNVCKHFCFIAISSSVCDKKLNAFKRRKSPKNVKV